MNIDFLVDKENKRVIVSNEKGTMKPREYQDNIKKVLVKEDVVKELESDYKVLKINRTAFEGRLGDTNKKIEKNRKAKKKYQIMMMCTFLGVPILVNIFFNITRMPFKTIGNLFLGGMIGIFALLSYFLTNLPDSPFVQLKYLDEQKKEYEKYIQKLNLEIVDLVQVITKNKAELQELIEQKERNNIEMISDEIQKISYREELEMEKSYLTQLREENIIVNDNEMDRKDSILGRFKKKKQY